MTDKPIVIMPFTLPWSWSADFQKQTCLELIDRGYEVVCFMEDEAKSIFNRKTFFHEKIKGITFFQPIFFFPFQRFKVIRIFNLNLSYLYLSFRYFFKKKIIWIFDPQFSHFQNYFYNKISLYDCVDYHDSINESVRSKFRMREKELLKNVQYVFANSHILKKIHSTVRRDIIVVPQGFKEKQYQKQFEFKTKTQPKLIGYIGGINHRFDFLLLYRVIKNNPNWKFIFVGPVQEDEQDAFFKTQSWIALLKKLPNTKWVIAKNQGQLIELVKQFKVAIIPYDIRQPINRYSYPMKLFEYLYAGKQVISTPLIELKSKKFSGLVHSAKTPLEWQDKIGMCLNAKPTDQQILRARVLAQQNSWSKKITKILDSFDPQAH